MMICSFASVLVCMFKMNYFSKFTRFIIYVFALLERIRSSLHAGKKMAVMQSILFSSAVSMYNTAIALWILLYSKLYSRNRTFYTIYYRKIFNHFFYIFRIYLLFFTIIMKNKIVILENNKYIFL